MKAYTDIEQSRHLLEIGIPAESADMCWGIDFDTNHYNNSPYPCPWSDYTCKEVYLPCWSLAALLEILPIINEHTYKLYGTLDRGCICEHPCTSLIFQEKSAVDAAFEMIVWLKERKYI